MRIITYTNNIIVDNYYIHCCFSELCSITLRTYNNVINVKLTKDKCLELDKNDINKFIELTFKSFDLSYNVYFNLLDCKVTQNSNCFTIQCNSKHNIAFTQQINNLLGLNYTHTNLLTRCFNFQDSNNHIIYLVIDNKIVKSFIIHSKANIFAKITLANKDTFKYCIKSDKALNCSFTLSKDCLSLDFTNLNLNANKLYCFSIHNNCNKTIDSFSVLAHCKDQYYNYNLVTNYVKPYKPTLNDKIISFIKSNGLVLVIALVIVYLWNEYKKWKIKMQSSKEELEKEE